jgi:hypothetical protein
MVFFVIEKSRAGAALRLSPLRPAPRSPSLAESRSLQPEDRAEVGSNHSASRLPLGKLAFGLVGLALSAGPVLAQVVQVPAPSNQAQSELSTRFFDLALGRGPQRPRGQALEVLKEYANTDFGQEMLKKVVNDFDVAIEKGWLDAKGDLTEEGEFAGFTPFRILHSDGSAQASLRTIELPERFASHFFGSGLRVFPLAIVHHEFGHTQFGQPPRPEDILTDQNGSRLRVEHEMEIVEKFENPVRLRYGYEARTSYRNHLGECAGSCPADSQ